MLRYVALALGAVLAVAAAHAQEMRTVTLLDDNRAMVDAAFVAAKDIASRFPAQPSGQSKRPIVEVRSCPKVSADSVQVVVKDLQAKNYIVFLDLKAPDPRICAR